MKILNLAAYALIIASLLPSMSSCKSDANPFDMMMSFPSSTENNKATIQLRLSVEDTRAGELSTELEKKINKVTVHVFNEKRELEATKNFSLTSGSTTVTMEVSHGFKTLYVVSEISNVNPQVGTSITDYENMTFISTLDKLKSADGFVMVGNSEEQYVSSTSSQDNLPASNIFEFKLKRLVAKAQVKSGNIDGTSFGITFGDASFKAFQLNQRMRVKHNGSDVFDSAASNFEDSNHNGTYDNYSEGVGDYLPGIKNAGDFTASGCAYMSENIVSVPKSGNTTFLSVRFATTPAKYYTFNSTNSKIEESATAPVDAATYYAVGIHDRDNGFVDYAINSSDNHIITFNSLSDATAYMNSLNKSESSALTVSQTESSLKAPAKGTRAGDTPQFEVITFDKGYAYYRVNIAHNESSSDSPKNVYKVVRNKFYKVNINSVSSLGFGSEDLLRPKNAGNNVNADGHSWISATISVEDWDEVTQNVDL
ncbi:MAG: Mfa1 family fimbria major subunit [Muribaculaceae bacterium]|nr:Mfa1 family fimbria major subunit [Muribaculaceae bacterium]